MSNENRLSTRVIYWFIVFPFCTDLMSAGHEYFLFDAVIIQFNTHRINWKSDFRLFIYVIDAFDHISILTLIHYTLVHQINCTNFTNPNKAEKKSTIQSNPIESNRMLT